MEKEEHIPMRVFKQSFYREDVVDVVDVVGTKRVSNMPYPPPKPTYIYSLLWDK